MPCLPRLSRASFFFFFSFFASARVCAPVPPRPSSALCVGAGTSQLRPNCSARHARRRHHAPMRRFGGQRKE